MIPLVLTVSESATDTAIQKNICGSGHPSDLAKQTKALIISNEETEGIMKIIKALKNSGLIIKDASETTKNKAKEQNVGYLGMLLGTLGPSSLGYMLAGKCVIQAGGGTIKAG